MGSTRPLLASHADIRKDFDFMEPSLFSRTKQSLRHLANRVLSPLELQIVRFRLESEPLRQLLLAISHHGIDLVIDVGANAGQYASDLLKAGYLGSIHSVEPQPDAHVRLSAAAQNYPRWKVLEPMAVGDRDGTVQMHVAGNSLSSSVLPMLDRHIRAAPSSAPVGRIQVPQRTIDQLFASMLESQTTLLKVDTQGYEPQVLVGAKETLKLCSLVQLELSLQPLYDGQELWMDVLTSMTESGFELWSMHPEFCDPQTGQLLQINALFSRRESRARA